MTPFISDKVARVIKNRKRLEKALNLKITNKGNEVSLEGAPEDEYIGLKVIEALDLGFSYSDAVSIKKEENELEVVNIKDYARRGNLTKVRGRVIGKGGKVLSALSELTKCSFEIKDNKVSIIGDPEYIKPALDALIQIIQGAKHANVYKGLEKRKDEPILDLGLRDKK